MVDHKTSLNLERVNLVVVIVVGIGTIIGTMALGIWKVGEWDHKLNDVMQENSKLKEDNSKIVEFISRQSQVSSQLPSTAPPLPTDFDYKISPTQVSANQLTGAWDLRFRSSGATGRIGVTYLGGDALEFHGELPQGGGGMPSLKLEGHGKVTGKTIQIEFFTRADSGEHWYGRGDFLIDSSTSLRGWYVDQVGRFDTIDVKRPTLN